MRFYKYWASGEATVQQGRQSWNLRAYGGSDQDLNDAIQRAQQIAARAAAAIEQGTRPERYGYPDRALREEIVQEVNAAHGLSAVITRNSYGALVLNTSRVMFVDVDYPPASGFGDNVRNLWDRLRGRSKPSQRDRDDQLLSRFREIVDSRQGIGLRVYRTAGGFRLLVTSATYDPISSETGELLSAFGSDPLYVRLCKAQECFRARLSAKHWRCGAARPPSRFPWENEEQEHRYREWEEVYHAKANQFAVCEPVGHLGSTGVIDDVQTVLDLHDRLTIQAGARLA